MIQSPYIRARDAICRAYEGKNRQPLSSEETLESLEITPGLVFPRGTTFEKIISKLESFGLIQVNRAKDPATRTIVPIYNN